MVRRWNPEAKMNTLSLRTRFERADLRITRTMARHGVTLLRISVGIVFLWFGAMKLFPGLSPAEDLVRATVTLLPMSTFLPLLAVWEMAIGLGFLTGRWLRLTILLLFLQMPGTLSPVFLLPERVFTVFPFGLTLEGQYIVKNLVLISAALVVGATVRQRRKGSGEERSMRG
ncbi:DoxX family protein [soil metagenome]|nr:DoxX family membrane protein [Gemmatimonadota bacterium]